MTGQALECLGLAKQAKHHLLAMLTHQHVGCYCPQSAGCAAFPSHMGWGGAGSELHDLTATLCCSLLQDTAAFVEAEPLSVLDFYVHESCQRQGVGKQLFEVSNPACRQHGGVQGCSKVFKRSHLL